MFVIEMGDRVSVLIADDEPAVCELYRLWLEDDCTVSTVENGRQALDRTYEDIDVVLLDRKMPGANGVRVVEHLSDNGFQGGIAMITGSDPDPVVARLPIDEYVTKPIDKTELRALVDRLHEQTSRNRGDISTNTATQTS